ncbi:ubiquitin carboxyl-terminal hydrolase isozyme L5 [Eurytemora carolleeae]|uniref:ubiquitin carboxyl-terminal hydrolase isozyme L5 n=1 Tax=Eurytemora carolleeae TaxID=1294199 RepID=UPI000C782DFA|nr:ubiquitin carboxyl-terminal hydrolase isozyme L5 [Eurytemora carolleeae]|eukprot:XP_023340619.1 ubiquitin carboxyl-terminal hydrolase isozyme L5-like [Eurytemora affinis]
MTRNYSDNNNDNADNDNADNNNADNDNDNDNDNLDNTDWTVLIYRSVPVINNACATQAILSVLMNISSGGVNLGPTLQDFKEFCSSFDAGMKGLTLSNSESIRTVHNSFSRQTLFEFDSKKPDKDDDEIFHFVSYVPIDGRIYELDGLKEGPVDHGPAGENWTDTVRPIIEQRMQRYKEGEIHFNLMGVVEDKIQKYTRLLEAGGPEVSRLEMMLSDEEARRSRSLASRGELLPIYEKAKEKTAALDQMKKQKKAAN